MKIAIERKTENNEGTFFIYVDGSCKKAFSFKINAPNGDPYNEQENRNNAMVFAKEYREPTSEIIYNSEIDA